ncbi:MAG: hypothetical protein KKA90_02565 [Nanoarchaeota archaeon]|nr:hypothetical protein [Nanoarchaeota archaeon]
MTFKSAEQQVTMVRQEQLLAQVRSVQRSVVELRAEVHHLRDLVNDAVLSPAEKRLVDHTLQSIKKGDTRDFVPFP